MLKFQKRRNKLHQVKTKKLKYELENHKKNRIKQKEI
jgi:hypothetical protein